MAEALDELQREIVRAWVEGASATSPGNTRTTARARCATDDVSRASSSGPGQPAQAACVGTRGGADRGREVAGEVRLVGVAEING